MMASMMKRLTPTAALLMGLSILMLRPAYPESIPLKLVGGTYVVPVLINGKIPLDFTLDTGATDVSIPEDVYGLAPRRDHFRGRPNGAGRISAG